jgi:membrane associated rhomboid family serine protease
LIPIHDNVPTRSFPLVTMLLIAANVAVWVFYQVPDLNGSARELAFQPCEVDSSCPPGDAVGQGPLVTAFTSMFMHGSWIHIAGNMLFLWIFGNNVEDAMGKVRFFLFYILSGLAATGLQTVVTLTSSPDAAGAIPNLGASGAISGVLGAYLLLLPRASVRVLVFFFFILFWELPAFLFLGFWFLFQLWDGGFSLLHPEAGGGVAFFAHIGGFVFGMATVFLFTVRRPLPPRY